MAALCDIFLEFCDFIVVFFANEIKFILTRVVKLFKKHWALKTEAGQFYRVN